MQLYFLICLICLALGIQADRRSQRKPRQPNKSAKVGVARAKNWYKAGTNGTMGVGAGKPERRSQQQGQEADKGRVTRTLTRSAGEQTTTLRQTVTVTAVQTTSVTVTQLQTTTHKPTGNRSTRRVTLTRTGLTTIHLGTDSDSEHATTTRTVVSVVTSLIPTTIISTSVSTTTTTSTSTFTQPASTVTSLVTVTQLSTIPASTVTETSFQYIHTTLTELVVEPGPIETVYVGSSIIERTVTEIRTVSVGVVTVTVDPLTPMLYNA